MQWSHRATQRPSTEEPARGPERRTRVLLVDDQELMVDALSQIIDREPDLLVIATARSLAQLAELAARPTLHADVILLGDRLPDGASADACRLARAAWRGSRVVTLTRLEATEALLDLVRAGADGCIDRSANVATVLRALRAATTTEMLLTPEVLGRISRTLATVAPEQVLLAPLTPRELTVLKGLALGQSTNAIAADLGVRPGTIRVYVEAIRRKFHASTRLEAVSRAVRHHIIEVPTA